jgi:hypothetical protein
VAVELGAKLLVKVNVVEVVLTAVGSSVVVVLGLIDEVEV